MFTAEPWEVGKPEPGAAGGVRMPHTPAEPFTISTIRRTEIYGTLAHRNRSPRAGLSNRKRHHDSGILSPVAERVGQRLQPEIEPRSRDAVARRCGSKRTGGTARTALGGTRRRRRQPRP